ncbi:uncharacterized protein LOC110685710 [Chenopodium quinoa]|uniref:uncharacterized protein LOC110685710 n=1 Tax=Chenopodium quinoa TaxID=63459 RepID=UPI000B797EBB|nr:uncharacterized protein LOC110685710 [Chenopodium quinoa]
MSDSRMVLKLVRGLTKLYRGVGTLICQSNPFPSFYQAWSMLILVEAGMAKEATTGSESAMVAASYDDSLVNSGSQGNSKGKNQKKGKSGNRKNSGGIAGSAGRGSEGDKLGQGYNGGSVGRAPGGQQAQPPPHTQQRQPGILGPCPQQNQQAYATSSLGQPGSYAPSYAPIDIESAMHTMTLSQPDPSWYIDTGATSHMTSSIGDFSSYFNLSNHPNNGIVVGNGHTIPIFTTDNSVTVEFDPFGFSVKDFQTGMPIMRCDSRGDLYPITSTLHNQAYSSTFAAISPFLS